MGKRAKDDHGERFGQLRQALHAPASQQGWLEITGLLESWPREQLEAQILPYCERYMDSWPDAMRQARKEWFLLEEDGLPSPKLQLARRVSCKILLWGPEQSGKTSCLRRLCQSCAPGELLDMDLRANQTGQLHSVRLRPGWMPRLHRAQIEVQVQRPVMRRPGDPAARFALRGCDAIILVCDAQQARLRDNQRSLAMLRAALATHFAIAPEDVDLLLLLNKVDKPDRIEPRQLQRVLGTALAESSLHEAQANHPQDDVVLSTLAAALAQARNRLLAGRPGPLTLRRGAIR